MKFAHPNLGCFLIPSYGGGQAFMTKNRFQNIQKTSIYKNKRPKRNTLFGPYQLRVQIANITLYFCKNFLSFLDPFDIRA
jgi:hypothetical protein